MTVAFRFESPTDDFVDVLGDSPVGSGPIASQNAGSSNPGLYYTVGGGGVNGLFARALRPTHPGGHDELARVNADLTARYDGRYGAGAWQADRFSGRTDRLTSVCVPLQHDNTRVHPAVAAMVYSVGPVIQGPPAGAPAGAPLIGNADVYRAIYADALASIASSGLAVARFRVSMVSTGIYAQALQTLAEKQQLFAEAAGLIISAFAQADAVPATVLINNGRTPVYDPGAGGMLQVPLIRDGFTAAAQRHGACATVPGGFDLAR